MLHVRRVFHLCADRNKLCESALRYARLPNLLTLSLFSFFPPRLRSLLPTPMFFVQKSAVLRPRSGSSRSVRERAPPCAVSAYVCGDYDERRQIQPGSLSAQHGSCSSSNLWSIRSIPVTRWDVMSWIPSLSNQCDGSIRLINMHLLSISLAVRVNQWLHLLIRRD